MIYFTGEKMQVRFDRFDLAAYDLFLRAKQLPESDVRFDDATETYTIEAPARFASILGVERPAGTASALPLSSFLFDDQVAITQMALDAKRFAVWSDCGLGKSLVEFEFARQVIARTGGRVLLITLNEIVNQLVEECQRFYGDTLPITRLQTRDEMKRWCMEGPPASLAITNYEKMNPPSIQEQNVPEMKYLTGIILDESSRLKTGGGKQKWALIKSCKGIEYKLSCTATPAPNDTMEFASQASFLEKMRSEGEIIWTYFTRDPLTQKWTVKKHAREAFFKFMAGWSIYVRDPKKYGWRNGMAEVPPPIVKVHELEPTAEQRVMLHGFTAGADGQGSLYFENRTNAIQRSKLSQVAKGFIYLKGPNAEKVKGGRKIKLIPSVKPQFVADLIRSEVAQGLQVLVWTVFDAESDIIADKLSGSGAALQFDLLTGKTKDEDRIAILDRFRRGESQALISRASMLGYGMNFQCCGSMIFSGWNDSFESYYQAVRRAYRFGQTRRVRVHLPVVTELEEDQLDNIFRKERENNAAIEEMEQSYIFATKKIRGVI